MNLGAVLHIPLSNFAFALKEDTLIIRLRTAKSDIDEVMLFFGDRVCEDDPITVVKYKMERKLSDELFDYYETELISPFTRVCYYFSLEKNEELIYYFGGDFSKNLTLNRTHYFQFPYIRREDIIEVPSWAQDAIMYQIFPDSFASKKRYISGEKSEHSLQDDMISKSKRGGTIPGIIENLDYLSLLGINCIYLNPIFSALEYHKYDTVDYYSIDPCFGTLHDFKLLVKECHSRSIRVILDGVFNHCGSGFFAFQDVLKNGEASPYKDWFYHLNFPIQYSKPPNYEAFAYVKEMPKLNTGNPEVIEYFCNVGTYWLKEVDIDGWRLDVANEVNHEFWREFRKRVKKVKPDALLIGEIWEDSETFLMGDQFDSTMNYRFSNLCQEFFALHSIGVTEFQNKMNQMLMRYQTPITYTQMNLLDSHDVPRFLYHCKGDVRKLKLAMFFMLTFVGIPSIFYGDEMLLTGNTEPKYRTPMVWEPSLEQQQVLEYLKGLIKLRKENPAFTKGDYRVIQIEEENGVFLYERRYQKECYLVIINNNEKERTVKLPTVNGEEKYLTLEAISGKVIKMQTV